MGTISPSNTPIRWGGWDSNPRLRDFEVWSCHRCAELRNRGASEPAYRPSLALLLIISVAESLIRGNDVRAFEQSVARWRRRINRIFADERCSRWLSGDRPALL